MKERTKDILFWIGLVAIVLACMKACESSYYKRQGECYSVPFWEKDECD